MRGGADEIRAIDHVEFRAMVLGEMAQNRNTVAVSQFSSKLQMAMFCGGMALSAAIFSSGYWLDFPLAPPPSLSTVDKLVYTCRWGLTADVVRSCVWNLQCGKSSSALRCDRPLVWERASSSVAEELFTEFPRAVLGRLHWSARVEHVPGDCRAIESDPLACD